MYNLINMYSVPTPPEDLFVFATLQPSIDSLQSLIDKAVLEREPSMETFCSSLQKGIKELDREVMNIKLRSQVRGKVGLILDKLLQADQNERVGRFTHSSC